MKMTTTLRHVARATALVVTVNAIALAQQPTAPQNDPARKKGIMSKVFGDDAKPKKNGSKGEAQEPDSSSASKERLEPDDTTPVRNDIPAETQANRRETMSEEQAAVVPYYNNFFSTYRLGPEDVISVSVFGQERYSKIGIVIPPNGRISYPLIPEGVFVNGKTVEEVQDQITKRLDEYIIDPKVTVFLDKAMSYRYSVVGDVAQPGVKQMTHRLTVREALAEAGGVLPTGDKKKVVVLRHQAGDSPLTPIYVNIAAIERGRAPDNVYLGPGDQVVVPGNRLKKWQQIMGFVQVLTFARIFTGGW